MYADARKLKEDAPGESTGSSNPVFYSVDSFDGRQDRPSM